MQLKWHNQFDCKQKCTTKQKFTFTNNGKLQKSGVMFRKFAIVATSFLAISACTDFDESEKKLKKIDPIDKAANLSREDYEKFLIKNQEPVAKVEQKAPPIPDPSDSLLKPEKPKIGINKTVTLSVTDDVPLKDVFIELARLADIDIEVDPSIEGGVIFKVKDKPFQDVIERITSIAHLRYSINNGVLRIERDEPYVVNYPVNFLNLNRSGEGNIAPAGLSGGGDSGGDSGGGSVATSSTSSITSDYNGDLWTSVEAGLKAIIGETEGNYVNINRQGGLISVNTNQDIQERVFNYLKLIKDFYSAQVLIEAKIMEVQLSDKFSSGVEWNNLNLFKGLGVDSIATTIPGSDIAPVATINFSRDNGDLSSVIDLVQVFGTTRTVSSPRIMALNNQQAVFSYVRNEIYFTIDIEEETASDDTSSASTTKVTVDSQVHTLPIGVVLSIQPSIDTKRNEVILNVRPTLSRTTGQNVADPGFALQLASIIAKNPTGFPDNLKALESTIPEVETREFDTVLRMHSGEVMAIGGMIEQRNENSDNGVPFISEIPIFGNAFKRTAKDTLAVQTVIFLKATIVPSYGVDDSDQEFYNKFSTDSRPFKF